MRFPALFLLFGLLTLFDLVVPDFIPFADEIGLGLLTLLFGSWRSRKAEKPAESGMRAQITDGSTSRRPGSP